MPATPASTNAVIVKAWAAWADEPWSPPLTVNNRAVMANPRAVPTPRLMFKIPEAMPACWGGIP